jgi:hypothetical protein
VAGKGSRSDVCRRAEQTVGQTCDKNRIGAVAVRAALALAVTLGRGDEVNRQAEMANSAKCRDSIQCVGMALPRVGAFAIRA